MAVAIAFLRKYPPRRAIRERLILITGDTSYPTGGSAISAANVQLTAITALLPQNPYPLVDRIYVWDRTNGKLIAQVASTGAQVANATDLSADKIAALVSGR